MKLLRKRREEFERLVAIALAIPEPRFFTQVGRIMDRLKSQHPEEMPTIRAWRIYHRVRFLCEGPPSFSEWQEICGLLESEAKEIAERLTLEFEVGREC